MSYTAPALTTPVVLTGSYTVPALSTPVVLGDTGLDRVVVIAGETQTPTGLLAVFNTSSHVWATVSGETLAPTGNLNATYDPNLLSAVHAVVDSAWQDGQPASQGLQEALNDAPDLRLGVGSHWQDAALLAASQRPGWQDSLHLDAAGADRWQDADSLRTTVIESWQQSPRLERDTVDRWQDAIELPTLPVVSRFRVRIPLLAHDALPAADRGRD